MKRQKKPNTLQHVLELSNRAETARKSLDSVLTQIGDFVEPLGDLTHNLFRQSSAPTSSHLNHLTGATKSPNKRDFVTGVDNIVHTAASAISSFIIPMTESDIQISPNDSMPLSSGDKHFYHRLSTRVQELVKSPSVGLAGIILRAVKSCLNYGNACIGVSTNDGFHLHSRNLGDLAILESADKNEINFLSSYICVKKNETFEIAGTELPEGTYTLCWLEDYQVPLKLTSAATYPWTLWVLKEDQLAAPVKRVLSPDVIYGRFERIAGRIYGYGCGLKALPALKELSTYSANYRSAALFRTNPPYTGFVADSKRSDGSTSVTIHPGDYLPMSGTQLNVPPLSPINMVISSEEVAALLHQRFTDVKDAYYFDLGLLLEQGNMSKLEVATRVDQKLSLLLPIVQGFQKELVLPILKAASRYVLTNILLNEPNIQLPEGLSMEGLALTYTSRFDVMRKRRQGEDVLEFATTVMGMAQVKPEVLEEINFTELVKQLSEVYNIPPSILKAP